MAKRVDYCGPVKTSHKVFCLATLEKLIKNGWGVISCYEDYSKRS